MIIVVVLNMNEEGEEDQKASEREEIFKSIESTHLMPGVGDEKERIRIGKRIWGCCSSFSFPDKC